jgi:hypothetical protein
MVMNRPLILMVYITNRIKGGEVCQGEKGHNSSRYDGKLKTSFVFAIFRAN